MLERVYRSNHRVQDRWEAVDAFEGVDLLVTSLEEEEDMVDVVVRFCIFCRLGRDRCIRRVDSLLVDFVCFEEGRMGLVDEGEELQFDRDTV